MAFNALRVALSAETLNLSDSCVEKHKYVSHLPHEADDEECAHSKEEDTRKAIMREVL